MADKHTVEQTLEYVHRLLSGELDTEEFLTNPEFSTSYRRDIVVLALYQLNYERERREARTGRQRRAMDLLRTFLSEEQRKRLRRTSNILVRGSAGGIYRLVPRTGAVHRVEKHGKHWFDVESYCLHDDVKASPDGRGLPPADLTLQHLLWLCADEGHFLTMANATSRRDQLWNGDWARQLREARAARAQVA